MDLVICINMSRSSVRVSEALRFVDLLYQADIIQF